MITLVNYCNPLSINCDIFELAQICYAYVTCGLEQMLLFNTFIITIHIYCRVVSTISLTNTTTTQIRLRRTVSIPIDITSN